MMTFDEWMARDPSGKHCATDDSVQTRLLRRCWDAATAATRQDIVYAMGSLLRCPCCGETMGCPDDCTFLWDCPAEAEQLAALRDAVRA
jgi:hypothetical protein